MRRLSVLLALVVAVPLCSAVWLGAGGVRGQETARASVLAHQVMMTADADHRGAFYLSFVAGEYADPDRAAAAMPVIRQRILDDPAYEGTLGEVDIPAYAEERFAYVGEGEASVGSVVEAAITAARDEDVPALRAGNQPGEDLPVEAALMVNRDGRFNHTWLAIGFVLTDPLSDLLAAADALFGEARQPDSDLLSADGDLLSRLPAPDDLPHHPEFDEYLDPSARTGQTTVAGLLGLETFRQFVANAPDRGGAVLFHLKAIETETAHEATDDLRLLQDFTLSLP